MPAVRGTRLVLLSLIWLGLLAAAPAASAANLRYWGGPVAHSMNVYVVEWGSDVRSTYADASTGDPGFFQYLAAQSGTTSDIGGVLAQYMDTTGANSQNRFSYGGLDQITPPSSGGISGCALPACVDDSVIQSQLRNHITGSSPALPAPAGNGLQTMYVVLFPPGTDVCQGGSCAYSPTNGFCAYHGSFPLTSSTHVLYAAMVDNGPGAPTAGECGSSSNDVANQTDVLSHEVAEAINDPLAAEATTNGPPLAWYDTRLGEVGDICVGSTEQAPNGPWTVQKIWSNKDNNCVAGESAYSAPTASFVANTTASPGQAVSFDASASTDPSGNSASAAYSTSTYSIGSGLASYRWNWGDGSTSDSGSSPSATHAYASTGNYQVSLTVTDKLGFTSTVTHQITIAGSAQAPLVTTGTASSVASQSATLNGLINPENQSVQYSFLYGTSPTALDQSTPVSVAPAGSTAAPVTAAVSGLTPATTYYYELQAVAGGVTYTDNQAAVQSFTTAPAASPPPPVQTPGSTTGAASLIGSTSAQLQGAVDPGGAAPVTYWFAYGTTPSNLGLTTPQTTQPGGSAYVPVSAGLSGLAPGTTYYYALRVALNGTTTTGAVNHLTTPSPPPSVATGAASAITSSAATVSGGVNPNGVATTYQVQFGPSTSYGYSSAVVSAGAGTTIRPVSVSLTGLRAGTTYHYRLVASNAGATVVGGDRTFTTAKPLAAAPSFSFRVLGRPALAGALRSGFRVRFTCSRACVAKFSVVVLPGNGVLRVGSVPLSIAAGTGRLRARGSGTAILSFGRKARGHLGRSKVLTVNISGVAGQTGTATSAPVLRKLILRRRA